MRNLREENIRTYFDNHEWININRQKTGVESNIRLLDLPGKAKQICPLWPKRIDPYGHNMIDPYGPNNIDHLVHILPKIFLCRFESPSPGVTGY